MAYPRLSILEDFEKEILDETSCDDIVDDDDYEFTDPDPE